MNVPQAGISGNETLHSLYAPVWEEMLQVEITLEKLLSMDHPFISQLTEHGFRLGGKRIRPALLLLTARMIGDVTLTHIRLGAAVEMVHMATLVHDDVLDDAMIRRHEPTVNASWGNEISVLLGDYMVARAVQSVTDLNDPKISHLLATTSCHLCEGEMRQIASRRNFMLSETEYLNIITDKTAALCECACIMGTLCIMNDLSTEYSSVREHCAAFGRELGMAFQIADDILDIVGNESDMGKSLGSDLEKQKMTLPIIRLRDSLHVNETEEFYHRLNTPDSQLREWLKQRVLSSGALESTQQTASDHLDLACKHLHFMPKCPARDSLENIARFCLKRNY